MTKADIPSPQTEVLMLLHHVVDREATLRGLKGFAAPGPSVRSTEPQTCLANIAALDLRGR